MPPRKVEAVPKMRTLRTRTQQTIRFHVPYKGPRGFSPHAEIEIEALRQTYDGQPASQYGYPKVIGCKLDLSYRTHDAVVLDFES